MSIIERSNRHYNRGIDLDNAGKTKGAIKEFTKAIKLDNHPMAYYCRACIYQDLKKYKKAIADFKSYLQYGAESSREGVASRVCIEELEEKLANSSKSQGERSEYKCPICKCNLNIIAKDVNGFMGSKQLQCPDCGQITVKL